MYTVYIIYINMENVSPFKFLCLFWLSILNFQGESNLKFIFMSNKVCLTFSFMSNCFKDSKLQKGYHVFDGICEDGSNEEQGPHQRIPEVPTTKAPRRSSHWISSLQRLGPTTPVVSRGLYITPLIDTV